LLVLVPHNYELQYILVLPVEAEFINVQFR
jgi:hypothetical protein